MNSVVTLLKILFALGLSFMATFQNGKTNAFSHPHRFRDVVRPLVRPSSHPDGVTPSSTALGMVPQHQEPDEKTSYIGDPYLGRPQNLSFNEFLTTYIRN